MILNSTGKPNKLELRLKSDLSIITEIHHELNGMFSGVYDEKTDNCYLGMGGINLFGIADGFLAEFSMSRLETKRFLIFNNITL